MTIRNTALIASLVALAVVVGVGVALGVRHRQDPQTVPTPTTTPSVPASTPPGYNRSAGDAGDNPTDAPAETQQAAWGPVADRFARNFTNTSGGATKWRKRLTGDPTRPDVTAAVAKQLATVDIRNVPDGRYESREVLKSSDYDLAIKINYNTGWAMVLYLITDGSGWQVYAYDKWEP